MSDKVATFWIVTNQDEIWYIGDYPRGRRAAIPFNLTEENYDSWAYITFMVKGVDFEKNELFLNNHFVSFLDTTPGDNWTQQTHIVELRDRQLFDTGSNTISFSSKDINGNTTSDVDTNDHDNFEIKNLIFHYRTHR